MTKIIFENLPSTNTPINAENLNKLNNVVINQTKPATEEEVWIQRGKNLFNKNNVTGGFRFDSKGLPYAEKQSSISEFIKVNPNTDYVVNFAINYLNTICYYDKSKTFISRNDLNSSFVTPSNCEYIRFSRLTSELDTTQLEQGSTATTFEEYIGKKIYTKNSNGGYEEFYNENPLTIPIYFNENQIYSNDREYLCFRIGNIVFLQLRVIAFIDSPANNEVLIYGLPKPKTNNVFYLHGGNSAQGDSARCRLNDNGEIVIHYGSPSFVGHSSNCQYGGVLMYETAN